VFDPDFKRAIDQRSGAVWDLATGRRIASLGTNSGPVTRLTLAFRPGNSVAFSRDGHWAVAASVVACDREKSEYASELRVWDSLQWRTVFSATNMTGWVDSVTFSPDATRLLGVMERPEAKDGATRPKSFMEELWIWEIATGKLLAGPRRILPASSPPALSSDGRFVAVAGVNGVEVIEVATGRLVYEGRGATRAVTFPAEDHIRMQRFGAIETRDLATGKQVSSIKLPGVVTAFGSDLRRALSVSGNTEVQVCDAESGKVIVSLSHPDQVTDARFSPDGRRVLTTCADKSVRLWDASTGASLGPPLRHETAPQAMFAPDGHRFVTLAGSLVLRIWSLVGQQPAQMTLLHHGTASHALHSPGGDKVLTASSDATVQMWEASDGRPAGPPLPLPQREQPSAIAFAANGHSFTAVTEKHTAQMWDATTFQPLGEPLLVPDYTNASAPDVCLSPDARFTAEIRRLPQAKSRGERIEIWDIASRKVVMTQEPSSHEQQLYLPAFSPDGTLLAVPGRQYGAVYEMSTGRDLLTGSQADFASALGPPYVLSPDNTMVLSARLGFLNAAPIWRVVFLGEHQPAREHECPPQVNVIAFSADSRRFVSAHDDGSARLWDVATLTPSGPVFRHRGPVLAACFSPNRRLLATGSADRTARIWDVTTGEPVTSPLRHTNAVRHVAFRADNRQLLTTAAWFGFGT
jgi:WD40 repeat protein